MHSYFYYFLFDYWMGVVYDWVLVWVGRWSKGEVLAWHMVWESSIEGIVNKELNYCLIIMVTLCVIVGPCCLAWYDMWSPKSVLLISTWLWALLEIMAEDNIGFQHTLHDGKTPHTELFHSFVVQCTMSLQLLLLLLSFMIRKTENGTFGVGALYSSRYTWCLQSKNLTLTQRTFFTKQVYLLFRFLDALMGPQWEAFIATLYGYVTAFEFFFFW